MESAVNLFSFNLSFDDIFSDLSKKPPIPVSSSNIAVAKVAKVEVANVDVAVANVANVDVVDEKVAVANVANVDEEVAKLTKNEEHTIELFKSTKKIPNKKLYTNDELNIKIYIAGQPDIAPEPLELWFKILRIDNIKLYITFNDNILTFPINKYTKQEKQDILNKKYNSAKDYSEHALAERNKFGKTCLNFDKDMYKCKFVSIEVLDYSSPTIKHLQRLWTELDLFYTTKDNKSNVLMHCTSGGGRSGFMLCSYIWLKKIQKEVNTPNMQSITDSTKIIKELLQQYATLSNDSDKYILYNILQNNTAIKYLIEEMRKFEPEIVYELFYMLDLNDTHGKDAININPLTQDDYEKKEFKRKYVLLFIERITNFIKAYDTYKP